MTGIAGYINRTGKCMPEILDRMTESMRYTERVHVDRWASDSVGVCRVYHEKTNPGQQPVFNEDRSVFILMDGEIFGHESGHERDALMSQNSEALYCLRLYKKLGNQAFKELNGSFSFAIFDMRKNELFLVTDRFSSRPLFYSATEDNALFFSSKLCSLLESPQVQRDLDITSIFEFLTIEKVFGTKTLYKKVQMVPPATVMSYRDGCVDFNRYWKLRFKNIERSDEYYADKLAQALRKAVERRTRDASNRYGLLLSGGLDSRVVLAASSRKMVTFTVECGNLETSIARKVARTKGWRHLVLRPTPDFYLDVLDKAVEMSDGLNGFEHAHLMGLLEQVQNECNVLFHGCYLDDFNERYGPKRTLRVFGRELGFARARLKMRTSFLVESYLASLSDQDFIQEILGDPLTGRHILDENPIRVFKPEYSNQVVPHLRSSIKELLKEARRSASLPSDIWNYISVWCMLPKHRFFLSKSYPRFHA